MMHIYIIAQYLNQQGRGEDRFWRLGREWVSKGHRVTLFTGGSGSGMELGRKNIGLQQKDGLTLVALNVPYSAEMSSFRKLLSYHRFARMAGKQGRLLPKPDLLVAATPPFSAARPAIKLKVHYGVPLVLEVRELWPDAPVERGALKNGLLIKRARRLEEYIYGEADRIVTRDPDTAGTVRERRAAESGVAVIPDSLKDNELAFQYGEVIKDLVPKNKSGFNIRI